MEADRRPIQNLRLATGGSGRDGGLRGNQTTGTTALVISIEEKLYA
jgi:hypothetical protein